MYGRGGGGIKAERGMANRGFGEKTRLRREGSAAMRPAMNSLRVSGCNHLGLEDPSGVFINASITCGHDESSSNKVHRSTEKQGSSTTGEAAASTKVLFGTHSSSSSSSSLLLKAPR